jgi:hypothetical protein
MFFIPQVGELAQIIKHALKRLAVHAMGHAV